MCSSSRGTTKDVRNGHVAALDSEWIVQCGRAQTVSVRCLARLGFGVM
jgi:hypothetical protein